MQAKKLTALLDDAGWKVVEVRTNPEIPSALSRVEKIPGLRTLLHQFLFMLQLRRALKDCDVVYFLTGFFNFFFWVTYPALVLIMMSGKPVVLSARGGRAGDFFARYKLLIAPVIRRIDLVTTPSGFLQQVFVDAFGVKPVIVPNIADLEQFHFVERRRLRPRLIVTRNLEEIYNLPCVLRAFHRVHERYPGSTLEVVGEGSQRSRLEALASELAIAEAVTFHGHVKHTRIQDLYAQSDIFVNGSNVDNLPGTILEAFACGLPVVSTRAGGIPYMIENEVTGLLVDCDDAEGLAAGVIRLLEEPDLARRLVANAYRESQKYSRRQVREALVPLLEKAISRRLSWAR